MAEWNRRARQRVPVLGLVALAVATWPAVVGAQAVTERVSVSSEGMEGNGLSDHTAISSDGRFVAFYSLASNLVSGDTNGLNDVFLRDRLTHVTERVSLTWLGGQPNHHSDSPAVSSDGRFVAFTSTASNVVSGDSNHFDDVFLRDRVNATTELVSRAPDGTLGNGPSGGASLSADGRYVAFVSSATNLVSGGTNGFLHVYVRDRALGSTELVSVSSVGQQAEGESLAPAISSDGRVVAFQSFAANLVSDDTNGCFDIFVHDRQTGATERVSMSSTGVEGDGQSDDPSITADGRFVAFESWAGNLTNLDSNASPDVFIRDRETGLTELISLSSTGLQGNSNSGCASVSADGRRVAFKSHSTNLVRSGVAGALDVFVRDRDRGTTELVSVGLDGSPGDGDSYYSVMASSGLFVAFFSNSTNLVDGDDNAVGDIFVRGPFESTLFADGFESGDTTSWSGVLPVPLTR